MFYCHHHCTDMTEMVFGTIYHHHELSKITAEPAQDAYIVIGPANRPSVRPEDGVECIQLLPRGALGMRWWSSFSSRRICILRWRPG